MGIDYLVCGNCGEGFPDCNIFASCICGENYCSECMGVVSGIHDEEEREDYKSCFRCNSSNDVVVKIIDDGDDDECYEREELYIDGELELVTKDLSDCPEDATLSRDIVSAREIARLMQQAYEWGKEGRNLVYEEVGQYDD